MVGSDMRVGDIVRHYDEDDWFFEGQITEITAQGVEVDFCDWVQLYPADQIRAGYDNYKPVLVALSEGIRVRAYAA